MMENNPLVHISLSKAKAETIVHDMADLLCWCRGYMAGEKDSENHPMGTSSTRELRLMLLKAIEDATP